MESSKVTAVHIQIIFFGVLLTACLCASDQNHDQKAPISDNTVAKSLKPKLAKENGSASTRNATSQSTNSTAPKGDGSVKLSDNKLPQANNTIYGFGNKMYKKGTMTRMIYVGMAISGIVVIYFVIRAIRLNRSKGRTKKYGLLKATATDQEMTPLDVNDDDDDDMTVFELPGNRQ